MVRSVINGRIVDRTGTKRPCQKCKAIRKVVVRVASRIRDVIRGK